MLKSLFGKPDEALQPALRPSDSFNDFSLGFSHVVEDIEKERSGASPGASPPSAKARGKPGDPAHPLPFQSTFNPGRNFSEYRGESACPQACAGAYGVSTLLGRPYFSSERREVLLLGNTSCSVLEATRATRLTMAMQVPPMTTRSPVLKADRSRCGRRSIGAGHPQANVEGNAKTAVLSRWGYWRRSSLAQ